VVARVHDADCWLVNLKCFKIKKKKICGVVYWSASVAATQEAGARILLEPGYEKWKTTSLFFLNSDNNDKHAWSINYYNTIQYNN